MANNVNANQTPVRLPVITLPTFSGNYEQWQQFYDTFKALIDDNTKLDPVQEFHYLRSALSGSAAQTIDSLQITNNNYDIALELLTKRFQNTRLTIQHHVHELFSVPVIPKESAESLRALSDNFKKHLQVLKQLEEPTDQWDTLIIYLVTSKLDVITKKEWELKVIQEKASTTNQLMDFLTERCEFLEALHPIHSKTSVVKQSVVKSNHNNSYKNQNTTHTYVTTNEANECSFCKQSHRIYSCKAFKDLTVETRRNEAKKLNLCYNCLRSNHKLSKCTSRACKYCSKKHHTLLHMNDQIVSNTTLSASSSVATSAADANTNTKSPDASATTVSMKTINVDKSDSEVFLSTAVIHIRDHLGRFHRARALLDNGSQSNFITKSMCEQLGLKTNSIRHTISCLDVTERQTANITQSTIASTTSTYETDVNLLVVNSITRSIPTKPVNIKSLSLPQQINLADPTFHQPQNIDLLLGATIFWDVLQTDRIQLEAKHLALQSTKLGWLVCGQMRLPINKKTHTICGLIRNEDIQAQIEKFWHIEECTDTRLLSREEAKCEEIFCNNHKRTPDGRFEVPLLFRESPEVLGESKSNALKRLLSMERKFQRNPQLQIAYTKFMDEYLELGHMSPLLDNENINVNYLPHYAVFKKESTSTKLRVVFDASCPTATGKSLNDCLLVGPTIQSDLFDILIRFRQHPYVLTGDITKMYRQIMIKPEHRPYQCILWRTDTNKPVTTFMLNTITYGTASAPFSAIRSLHQLSIEFEHVQPQAAMVISRDFYVDDMITGESLIQQLMEIKTQVTNILKTAGFELRKFRSNTPLESEECLDNYEITDTKILGLLWQSNADLLSYKVNCKSTPDNVTKRVILSLTTQIFDPFGLIGPIIIKAKILLQSLWQIKINWDTPVPETIRNEWLSYYQQLYLINQLHTELVYISDPPHNDAGAVRVHLLAAKSRVAPLKVTTLPKLELCGALLLAKLFNKVIQALSCRISKYYLWTDSEIALAWIQAEPSKWSIFVSNRIAEIQRLTNEKNWSHVRSEHNPADIISRGRLPAQLLQDTIWWEGPSWLKKDCAQWPLSTIQTINEVPKMNTRSCTLLCTNDPFDIINRYSSLTKLKRVIATCLRFKVNCELSRLKRSLLREPLTTEEIRNAMIVLIKIHQKKAFPHELHNLQRNKAIDSHSKILSLNPIINKEGILRVGGRLRHAPLSYSQKHPILLSSNSTLTELIIRNHHLNHYHMGPQLILTTLRETYWIIHAKNAIKQVLKKCILCFRLRPRSLEQRMGDLPLHRVTPSRVFNHTGIDYAGPFNIKLSRNKSGKAYVCLFVCMATKAVHIELASDLTTEAFLNALKRFISRRGKCESIWSDNGRNFLGASHALQSVGELLSRADFQEKTINFASSQGISWKFIPPHSPHMGGLWEANIKSIKTHFKAVINDTLLSFKELYTVLTQIEAILNSRPLCPLNNAPDELEVLTPGHFPIGTSLLALPEESALDIPSNRVNRYQLVTQLQQSFGSVGLGNMSLKCNSALNGKILRATMKYK